jgi:UDP-N-acetylmuramyl pentapeptide phosphotransferase/UDP-N-acetylglucosamine-1-phosphate transferase
MSGRLGRVLQDIPNARSLHEQPVPRIGGIGIVAGLLCGWLLLPALPEWWLLLPCIGLFIVSLLDDLLSLSVSQRLFAHLLAAALLLYGSGVLATHGPWLALPLLLLIVWVTNLYNFMDGSDGLAGGMALFGFAFLGMGSLFAQAYGLAMLNFSISAAALGFLVFNLPPAKVFMGDAGSIPLGFLAAAMGLTGWQQGCWAPWFPLLVFSPFVVDASVTLIRRTLHGARITEAHREHYYQRAVQMGGGHRSVALVAYGLMAGCGITAMLVLWQAWAWPVLLCWACIYGALMFFVDAAWKRSGRSRIA